MNKVESTLNGHPEIIQLFGFVGGMGGGGVNQGNLFGTLVPPGKRKMTQVELQGVLRRELNSIRGSGPSSRTCPQQGFTAQRGFPVEFSVRGSDWNQLSR